VSRLISIAWFWRPRARLPPAWFFAPGRTRETIRPRPRSNDTRQPVSLQKWHLFVFNSTWGLMPLAVVGQAIQSPRQRGRVGQTYGRGEHGLVGSQKICQRVAATRPDRRWRTSLASVMTITQDFTDSQAYLGARRIKPHIGGVMPSRPTEMTAASMAPCLQWSGRILCPSQQLFVAFGRTRRLVPGDEPWPPKRPA
jgi:hypothetical protein